MRRIPDAKEWSIGRSFLPCVFFGMYHVGDLFEFTIHRGRRTLFWCGADILALHDRPKWQQSLLKTSARHICENEVEQRELATMGIKSEIHPMLFDPITIPLSYKWNPKPNVYLTAHKGREEEYGVGMIERVAPYFPEATFHIYGLSGEDTTNISYHGQVSEKKFLQDIKGYQAAFRWNKFDGFAETLAKSALMGQYPVSRIAYPHITHAHDARSIVEALRVLGKKREPNIKTRAFWKAKLDASLKELLR